MSEAKNRFFISCMVNCINDLGDHLSAKEKNLADNLVAAGEYSAYQIRLRTKYLHLIRNIIMCRIYSSKANTMDEISHMFSMTPATIRALISKRSYELDLNTLNVAYAIYANPVPRVIITPNQDLGVDPFSCMASKICFYANCIATL